MSRLSVVSVLLFSFLSMVSGQKNYVEADGIIEYHNRIPLSGATLVLYDGDRKVKTLKTDQEGHYNFILEYNKEYILEISKKNLVTKKVKYNTVMPPKSKGGWWVGIPINLYEVCPGIDASLFEEPVAIIRYDKGKKEFEADPVYDNRMRSRVRSFESKNNACLEDKFVKLVRDAEQLAKNNKYDEAWKLFKEASEQRPWEPYPKEKLNELKASAAKQDAKKTMYDQNIALADKLMNEGNYIAAKSYYKRASSVRPSELYPGQKIREIDGKLAKKENQYQASLKNEYKEKQEQAKKQELEQHNNEIQYQNILKSADNFLAVRQYEAAKTKFAEALALKPDEQYPKLKIDYIDKKLSEQALLAEKQEVQKKYNKAITDGDGYMAINEYSLARQSYNLALAMRPNESYPKLKIAEINKKIAEENNHKLQQQKENKKYDDFVRLADNYFNNGNLNQALDMYTQAVGVKPNESYPKEKIRSINEQLHAIQLEKQKAEQEEKEYKLAIELGDRMIEKGDLTNAKLQFMKALRVKNNDVYAQSKINEIDARVASLEARKLAATEQKKEYNSLITAADELLNGARYDNAKNTYKKALEIDPSSDYARKRIAQINDILAKLAASNKIIEKESKKIKNESLSDLKFKDNAELEIYLVELKQKYPEGITLEIYKEEKKTIRRFIVVRNDQATEYREIQHYWGGYDYSKNDKPITQQYFSQQTKRRTNEYYNMVEM